MCQKTDGVENVDPTRARQRAYRSVGVDGEDAEKMRLALVVGLKEARCDVFALSASFDESGDTSGWSDTRWHSAYSVASTLTCELRCYASDRVLTDDSTWSATAAKSTLARTPVLEEA